MKKVAFICVHNSCRSQIAEALGKHLAGDVFESYSAGTELRPQINQDAVRLMKKLYGIDMEKTQRSKLLSHIPKVDVVITMGCNVQCPALPCAHREDWGLEDPSGKDDSAFLDTIQKIEAKILALKERILRADQLFCQVADYIDRHYVEPPRQEFRAPTGRAAVRQRKELLPTECCAPCPLSLEDMLKQEDVGFSETLLRLIDKTGQKDSAIYSRANVSRQHFSKIRNDPGYRPTKATALAFAIALELDLEATRDLIGRAGYALTSSSKFDLIIRYFIEQKNYDIMQINAALFEFDQHLLGV